MKTFKKCIMEATSLSQCLMIYYKQINWHRALFEWDMMRTLLTAMLLFLGVLGWRTVSPPEVPFVPISASADGHLVGDTTHVEYDREFDIKESFVGTVSRTVDCEGKRTYDVPPLSRPFTKGKYSVYRTLVLPVKYPLGTRCVLKSFIEWHPPLSFSPQIIELDPVAFEITAVLPHQATCCDATTQ